MAYAGGRTKQRQRVERKRNRKEEVEKKMLRNTQKETVSETEMILRTPSAVE